MPAPRGYYGPSHAPRSLWRRFLLYLLLLMLILALSGIGGAYLIVRRSLPQETGQLAVAGLQSPVTVTRDERGVPHIVAQNRHDLYFAQGYITATDRLFQLDLSRRAAAGRLSEIFGEGQVETDKFLRSLMLRKSAEQSLSVYSQTHLDIMQAYADGVNARIIAASGSWQLPPEFLILGYQPEPWTAVDSASIGKFMAYDLGGNWSAEVWRYQLIQRVGAERAAELLPDYPADGPTIMTTLQQAGLDTEQLDGLMRTAVVPDPWLGSNNWVLAGSRSASGKPLLANDMHLGIRTPAIWYLTHLSLPAEGLNVTGATFPGAPGIVAGRNDHIAWGYTNLGPDVQDLFVEIPNPNNPREFLYNGRFEAARVYDEPIQVKGRKEPVPFTLTVTRHGPIITPVAGSRDDRPAAALALRWTAHESTAELAAVLAFNQAKSWTEFRAAARQFAVPAQNIVFAAADGTIAYRGNGRIPIRRQGSGLLPVPGWTDEFEWVGTIPFERLPEVVNPPEGFIATANNKVIDDRYPYFIAAGFAPPYRAQRIVDVVKEAHNWTVRDLQELQNDYTNLQAAALLPVLLPALEQGLSDATPLERGALGLLQAWNQVDDASAAAPAAWHTWYRELQRELYVPLMGEDLWKRMTDATQITDRLLLASGQGLPSGWVPEDGLAGAAARSFRKAVASLRKQQGGTAAQWQWGKLHTITFGHPLGSVQPLNLLFNVGPFRVAGGSNTVAAMSYPRTGPGFAVTSSAPWRVVVDMAEAAGWDRLTPGQSGHPLSRHYGDQARTWVQGEYGRQYLNVEEIQNPRTLQLVPRG